jgi:hypothetical protein
MALALLKRHWKKIALFGALFSAYLVCSAPDVSWVTPLGDDLGDIMLGPSYMRPIHSPGYPLLAFLGWIFVHLPGNDFWNMALLSNLSFAGSAFLIFLIVQKLTDNSYSPYIAAITFGAAPLVFGQAIVSKGPEYGLAILLCLLTYYFIKVGRNYAAAIAAALTIGTHLIAVAFVALLFIVYLRKPRYIAIALSGLVMYAYVPLALRPPFGQSNPTGNSIELLLDEVLPVVMTLHRDGLLERMKELALIVVSGLGLGLLVPIKFGDTDSKILLGFSSLLFFYCLTVGYSAHVEYMVFVLAFVAIVIGKEFGKLEKVLRFAPAALLIVPLITLVINTQLYDIGRTLDQEPTAARRYLNDLEDLPENSLVISYYTHTYTLANYYECGENPNKVVAVSPAGLLHWSWCPDDLRARGVNIPERLFDRSVEETWIIFKEANNERPIYWGILPIEATGPDFKLVEAGGNGLPSERDFVFGFWGCYNR